MVHPGRIGCAFKVAARKRIQQLFESRAILPGEVEAENLLQRSRKLLDKMHAEDREEAIDLHEKIEIAIDSGDEAALAQASKALREMLFFMEGKPN